MFQAQFQHAFLDIERQERERRAQTGSAVRAAKQEWCARRGCHPIAERFAKALVLLGIRYHAWAAPASRKMTATSAYLPPS